MWIRFRLKDYDERDKQIIHHNHHKTFMRLAFRGKKYDTRKLSIF